MLRMIWFWMVLACVVTDVGGIDSGAELGVAETVAETITVAVTSEPVDSNPIWFADVDGDGYGDPTSVPAKAQPPGWVDNDGDCDDGDPAINPDADEVCDSIDNNCDGDIDIDAIDAVTWYVDVDRDGYGDADVSTQACKVDDGWSVVDGDCDDGDFAINPAAYEVCDEVDNDCDGEIDEGFDADGEGGAAGRAGAGSGSTETAGSAAASDRSTSGSAGAGAPGSRRMRMCRSGDRS